MLAPSPGACWWHGGLRLRRGWEQLHAWGVRAGSEGMVAAVVQADRGCHVTPCVRARACSLHTGFPPGKGHGRLAG